MRKKLFISIICLLLIFALFGCGEDTQTSNVTLNKNSLMLVKGETFRLSLTKDDVIITDGINWESMDSSVASVDKGLVIAKKEGITLINCEYNGEVYQVSIKVIGRPALNFDSLTIEVGYSKTLTLSTGNNQITDGVEWSTSDSSIVSIKEGVVTAKSVGDTIVKAKYDNKVYMCMVEVIEAFDYVGKFTCHVVVPEMDNEVFDFEIIINDDNTYVYKRFENENYPEWQNTGKVEYDSGIISLIHNSGQIRFETQDKDTFKSIGKIITGGRDAQLTFVRFKESL